MNRVESMTLNIARMLNSREFQQTHPWIGEDLKVMGDNAGHKENFTIALAFVGRFIQNSADYFSKKKEIATVIAESFGFAENSIAVNTADDEERESIYLTVNGTSAEAGDDGEVGRGNRVNGLITPYRPMSLEASAGKNPVSHVGKIYNLFAFSLAAKICELKMAEESEVYLMSQIGKPITEPRLFQIRTRGQQIPDSRIEALALAELSQIAGLWRSDQEI